MHKFFENFEKSRQKRNMIIVIYWKLNVRFKDRRYLGKLQFTRKNINIWNQITLDKVRLQLWIKETKCILYRDLEFTKHRFRCKKTTDKLSTKMYQEIMNKIEHIEMEKLQTSAINIAETLT